MNFRSVVACFLLPMVASAWVANVGLRPTQRFPTTLPMAMDYNDPVVAEEFAQVRTMEYDDVVAELGEKGIPVKPSMNDMEIKLMLVEMRLRFAGKLGGQKKRGRPTKFSSKLEEATWTKPAFEELYNNLKAMDDHNSVNVAAEYVMDPVLATQRYGKTYKALLRKVEAALNAAPPVKSPTLTFSGFPANMGEAGCKMTLGAFGPIVDFECEADDTFPVLKGKVTFEDIEAAKKAVAQYNGMNMGMGSILELASI
jgi:hypothetical protein